MVVDMADFSKDTASQETSRDVSEDGAIDPEVNFDPQAFADAVIVRYRELCLIHPDIDPEMILGIVEGQLRPFGTGRRFFIRESEDGYVI